jgi:transposase
MFIKKSCKTVNGKKYVNHLLVESVNTPKGPRHKVICSLGNLDPGPSEKWLRVAQNIEKALSGQLPIESDPIVEQIVEKIKSKQEVSDSAITGEDARWQTVDTETFSTEDAREAGPVHVGHQMWEKLQLTEILKEAGLNERACQLTEVMTINRLVEPSSELATVEWLKRTALPDILGEDIVIESPRSLYRNMDRLHPARAKIEASLSERERTLFSLDDTVLLYDLTSTFFEGQSLKNDKAQHGYSRDNRPDCKQVVIGLVVNAEGFPKGHEVFDGNRSDTTTVDAMLDALDERSGGLSNGRMIIVDRGMSSRENLASIRARGYHYMVAMRQSDRDEYLAELEDSEGWLIFEKVRHGKYYDTVLNRIGLKRASGAAVNAAKQKKVKSAQQKLARAKKSAESAQDAGENEEKALEKSLKAVELSRELKLAEEELAREETLILCVSQGRAQKDRAIREKQEKKLLLDLASLQQRVDAGKLKPSKVHENIGRLKERYSRVFRYYNVTFDEITNKISYAENAEKKELAKELDGSYIIRTDRNDLSDREIWQAYMLLTRIEAAFRDMKSPLGERPIYHQTEHRVETHIFICVLAYHLLVAIEKMLRDGGSHDSWETVRKTLRTHQVVTTTFPTKSGQSLKIRKSTTPEPTHTALYRMLKIPATVMTQRRWWVPTDVPATTPTS